jgi:hypothetical protein
MWTVVAYIVRIFAEVVLWLRQTFPNSPSQSCSKDKPVDSVPYRIAVHEAGHAVAAWACSCIRGITEVTVESKTGGGHVRFTYYESETDSFYWCKTVISLAGWAAEMRVFSKARAKPAEGDLLDARTLVSRLSFGATPPWKPTAPPFDFTRVFSFDLRSQDAAALAHCYAMASHLISSYGDRFDQLVALLLTKKTVVEKELESVLGSRVFVRALGPYSTFFMIPMLRKRAS